MFHFHSNRMNDAFTGEPITRTKHSHPYSYQPFETFNNGKESTHNVWSDRLLSWDYDSFNRSAKSVWNNEGQVFYEQERRPDEIERFLRLYYKNESLVLNRIVESCNQHNGYPVWYFAFSMQSEQS